MFVSGALDWGRAGVGSGELRLLLARLGDRARSIAELDMGGTSADAAKYI